MAVFAAVVGCWSSEAQAQDLVDGSYYIKNVKTGKFLVGGNSWGTQASLGTHGIDFILTKLPEGAYTLDSQISNGNNNHYLGSNGYVDAASANMTIVGDGNGIYTITADGTKYLSSNADNTVVAFDAASDSEYAQWQFLTREDMFAMLDDATSDNPVDATFFVKGQNFGRNDTRNSAWNGSPTIGGADDNMCAERFEMAFDVYQDVTGVPAGKYKLYCQGFFRYGSAADALSAHNGNSEILETVLYANDSEAPLMSIFNEEALQTIKEQGITGGRWSTGTINGVEYNYPNDMASASAAFSAGLYQTSLDVVVGETGAIKMGFKKETTTVPGGNWTIFDNFEIYYLGLDDEAIAAAKTAMTNLQNEAKALYDSPMEASVLEALKAQVSASELSDAPKASEIATKTANLNDAIADANTSIAAYEALNTAIEKATEIVNSVFVYKEEDKTNYTNAIAEAQAAYANGSYTNEQATEMQKKLWNTDYKSETLLARPFISSVWSGGVYTNSWSNEADNKVNGSGMVKPFVEYWTGDGNSLEANEIKAELSNIEAGSYNVTALVRVRIKNNSEETPHGITMQANDASAVDVCGGKTCDDGTQFRYDVYSTVCEVKEDGALTIAFNVVTDNNISWLSFKDVKYVKVADAADYENLSTAIATAESKKLGFAEGEYAPYNNVEAITVLQEAKLVDMTGVNEKSDILAIIERLNAAEWTANTEEVNAVYNGNFAKCENDGPMPGWQMSNNTLGGALHSRAFVGDDRLTEFNETKSAAFLRFDGTNSDRGSIYTYGNAEGYTMPLKANTIYYLSVDVKGWGSTGKPIRLNLNGPEEFSSWYSQITTENNADTDDTTPQRFYYVFNTGNSAGDYRISFQVPGSDDNKHNIVVSNIELLTAKAEDITVTFKAEYSTMILPFEAEIPTGMKVYGVTTTTPNGEYNTLNLEEETKIAANTPYIIRKTDDAQSDEFTFNGIACSEENVCTSGLLTGVVKEDTQAPAGSYVLQNQDGVLGFYKVSEDADKAITVPVYHAYLTIENSSEVGIRAFIFGLDDNTTSVGAVAADEDVLTDVYSINGVLVRKGVKASEALNGLQKGLYIVNGVKRAVK